MFIITVIIVATGFVVALAMVASASRPSGSVLGDVLLEDEHIRPINMAPKPFTTSHQGIAMDARHVISAAGLQ